MEYLDIVDDNNNIIEKRVERKIAHEKKLWHRHVACWIMNTEGKVLLQKRAETKIKNRGMWDKTAGGHINSEETAEESIQREVKEELGITIPKNQIKIVDIYKSNQEKYFGYNFIFVVDYKIEHFILQREEVSDIKFFDIEELEEIKKRENKNYTFTHWSDGDFEKEMEMLKKYRESLNVNKSKMFDK